MYFVIAPDGMQFTRMYKNSGDALSHAVCKLKYGKWKCKLTEKSRNYLLEVMIPQGYRLIER